MKMRKETWPSQLTWFITPGPVKDGAGEGGGTLQGRITCQKGAHQTDPEEIQACYRSRWDGGVLVSMDLSQIELRVAALLSGEPSLVDAYQNDWDLHGRRAENIWSRAEILKRYPELVPLPIDRWKQHRSFDKKERWVAKQMNFADLFRSGPDTMQKTVLDDVGELFPRPFFEEIARSRPLVRPVLWEWQEERIREANETGKVELPFTGQSRAFLGGDKYEVNEIVNFPVQTTAGNTMLRIQSRMSRALWKNPRVKLFLNVYDALKFDCAGEREVEELKGLIGQAVGWVEKEEYWAWLQEKYGRKVPLKYDLAVG